MDIANYNLFRLHLLDATSIYPNLRIVCENDREFLKGIINIPDNKGNTIGQFFIEIHYHDYYPYLFPKLLEVGGDIPNQIDWHKYPDCSCCITVLPDERIQCSDGITIIDFIQKFAIPYFANQIFRKISGHYKNGEYSHGLNAIREFYSDLFGNNELFQWVDIMRRQFGDYKLLPRIIDGHCFCGSEKRYEQCHKPIFKKLSLIGLENIKSDFEKISTIKPAQ